MVCRSKERGEQALGEVKEKSSNQEVHLHICDVAEPSDIRKFVEEFKSNYEKLDVLVKDLKSIHTNYQPDKQCRSNAR